MCHQSRSCDADVADAVDESDAVAVVASDAAVDDAATTVNDVGDSAVDVEFHTVAVHY